MESEGLREKGKTPILTRFRNAVKDDSFNKALQKEIKETLIHRLSTISSANKISLLSPQHTDCVIDMLDKPGKILCDCPDPVYGSLSKLNIIPEPQRLQKNYFERINMGRRVSEVWHEVHCILMNIVSKGRVYCHPHMRDTIMAALGPQILNKCLEKTISDFE